MEAEDTEVAFLPYDIVQLTSTNETLNEGLAYVTRIPPMGSGGRSYLLWYPGDPDEPDNQPPRLMTYRAGSEEGEIQRIRLQNRPEDASIQRAIRAEQGRFVIGVPSTDYHDRHTLQVVRTEPNAIYCVRISDLAETVIRIPLNEEGIGETSPYVFLMPAEGRDADATEEPVTPTTPTRDREIQRLRESESVRIIREDLPEYIVRQETLRTGGTRDTERLRGQIVAAVGAIGKGTTTEHASASERIKNLILRETKQSMDGREEIFHEKDPVLLREINQSFPEWIIPIDGSHREEVVPVDEVSAKNEGDPPKYVGIPPSDPSPETKKLPLRENIATLRSPYVLSRGEGHAVEKRTPYIMPPNTKIFANETIQDSTDITGEHPVVRIATPSISILNGGDNDGEDSQVVIPADHIQPDGAVILPLRYYVPPGAPLVEGVRGWTRTIPSKKGRSGLVTLVSPPDDVALLLDTLVVLDNRMAPNIPLLREVVSLPLPNVLRALGPVIAAGWDETSSLLETFGYTRRTLTHTEMNILSAMSNDTCKRSRQQRREITMDDSPIRIPRPDALFRNKKDLRAAYPDTLGLIGPWEAFHRITTTPGDYGSLLYTIRSIHEYATIQEYLKAAAAEAAGKRERIREEMGRVQENLQEIDSRLRTLPNIAKHYESRKDIEVDNRGVAEKGITIKWDESRDDDPMKHLYTGERFQKITGSILTKMQTEGTLPLDVGEDDIDRTDAICPTGTRDSFAGISPEVLLDAVKRDIVAYNAALPVDTRMDDDRVDEIVKRVILGGRPVADGDVALITRHLRTAAYTWNGSSKKWTRIKDEGLKVQGDDVTVENIQKVGVDSLPKEARSVYSQTLELNRKYRVLSKTRDDLALADSIPGMHLRRDDMEDALGRLFERGEPVYQKRRRCIKNNRILDEAPFLYDMLDVMLRRNVTYVDGDDGDIKRTIANASDLRRARLADTLVVDIEQAVYETGYGKPEGDEIQRAPGAGFIPDESLITDPRILEANRRGSKGMAGASFITEVKPASDRARRAFLLGVGLVEALVRTSLLSEEVAAMVTEASVITDMIRVPRGGDTLTESIIRGAVFCMLLLMTRHGESIELPTTEGVVPPPARDVTPSYFYPPAKGGDDERMTRFLYEILRKAARTTSDAKDAKYRTPEQMLGASTIFMKKRGDDSGIRDLFEIASRLSRSSPAIVDRSFRAQRSDDIPRTYGAVMTNRSLRQIGMWETIPVGYRPSGGGKLILDGKRVLNDEVPLRTDPFGVPVRENAAIASPVHAPELRNALKRMGRERSEALYRVLYGDDASRSRQTHRNVTILRAPAYDFIGIPRERIPEIPPNRAESETALSKSIPTSLIPLVTTGEILFSVEEPSSAPSTLQAFVTDTFQAVVDSSLLDKPTGSEAENATETFLRFGSGEATLGSGDANGSTRAEMIAVHDALIMAVEETHRALTGQPRYSVEPVKGGSYAGERGPLYGIHNRVKPLLKGVTPEKIETGSGGGRLAVLVGENSYYSRVSTLVHMMTGDLGIHTPERAVALRILVRDFLTTITEMPDRIPRETILRTFVGVLRDRASSGSDDVFAAIDAYVALFANRYIIRGERTDRGVVDDLRDMAADYTDVTPSMIAEEANKDREMERQLFIYRLDGLDRERKKITKALQSLGLTLEGRVAADPTRFNAEYYTQQSELVADREMRMRRSAGDDEPAPEDGPRDRAFGDAADEAFMEAAREGAPEEAAQQEDLDYDA